MLTNAAMIVMSIVVKQCSDRIIGCKLNSAWWDRLGIGREDLQCSLTLEAPKVALGGWVA